MADDRYRNFGELAANERRDSDYRIYTENRRTPIVVLAPHGGRIEPGTSEIAKAIAQRDFSIYMFEGLRHSRRRPHDLHITSTNFDEPDALKLIGDAEAAVAIHGRKDRGDSETVYLGGLHGTLRDLIASSLKTAGFAVACAPGGMAAHELKNICNRGSAAAGVQLELPRTLRDKLERDPARLRTFCDAVREAMSEARKTVGFTTHTCLPSARASASKLGGIAGNEPMSRS